MTDPGRPGQGSERDAEWLNSLFLVLADECRRHALRYFITQETDAAAVDDLIEYVQARHWKEFTDEELQHRFHHFTLPKLVEHDVVEFDARSRTVRYRGPPILADLLEVAEESDLRAE